MLHGVTLGGTGSARGDRHPKVGKGVLLGAGAKVLGAISIGDYAKIARRIGGPQVGAGPLHRRRRPRAADQLQDLPRTVQEHGSDPGRRRIRLRHRRLAADANAARFRRHRFELRSSHVDQRDIDRVQAHLKRTFGNPHIAVKARPKQKD